jgi:Leucine-rich repeat (LRR) protein
MPPDISSLTTLESLSLASNWLRELPPELAQLPHLKVLDVSDNLLDGPFPATILAMSQLEALNIGNTRVEDLPEAFGGLRHLRRLEFELADFKTFPRALLALPELAELNLYGALRRNS